MLVAITDYVANKTHHFDDEYAASKWLYDNFREACYSDDVDDYYRQAYQDCEAYIERGAYAQELFDSEATLGIDATRGE